MFFPTDMYVCLNRTVSGRNELNKFYFLLQLNNVLLGTSGSQKAGTFNNLPNASIGNIGMSGASVTNLQMKVSGM